MSAVLRVGDVIELDIDRVAQGGSCVGRAEGVVVFVRGTLPGERVRARVTAAPSHGRFARADTVDVMRASPDRVSAPCAYAGTCGGCDWQHASLSAQREGKAAVIREQLERLGAQPMGRWRELTVEAVPGDENGLHWRTRVRFAVDKEGRAGLHPYHSHAVLPVERCLLATTDIEALGITGKPWRGFTDVLAIDPDEGPAMALPDAHPGDGKVIERAVDRTWRIDATAFWQVHPGAANTLAAHVLATLRPRPGEHAVDLYSGVGLFAAALAEPLGPGGRVDAVESDSVAVRGARRSLHDLGTVRLHEARVLDWLRQRTVTRCDLVVLDPPRSGAGTDVVEKVIALNPRAIAYVACDPAALARDVAAATRLGWELAEVRAFDLFPMTHHVECVALLVPADLDLAVTVSA